MPSPNGQRVAPTISEEIKKKIQLAVRSKENKIKKGVKKENIAEEVNVFVVVYVGDFYICFLLGRWRVWWYDKEQENLER